MSSKTLEIYAQRARTMQSPTLASGRILAYEPEARRIVPYIEKILDIESEDTLLDIGAGIGQLAIPLSFRVASVTAIDHPDVLARLQRSTAQPVECIPGDFLELDLGERRFSRILVYDVLHYLTDQDEVLRFIEKAIGFLAPHGKMLLGNVRNQDYLERVKVTDSGKRVFAERMRRLIVRAGEQDPADLSVPVDREIVDFGDRHILGIVSFVRAKGHHAWLLGQPHNLPLWHQREDILVEQVPVGPERDEVMAVAEDGTLRVFSLRRAEERDCAFVYALSQEPSVRAASIRTETFTMEQHQEWYARKLADTDCTFLVLELEGRIPVATLRLEVVRGGRLLWTGGPPAHGDGSAAEIAIAVVSDLRGSGVGRLLLDRGREWMRGHSPQVNTLVALVRPENTASLKAFASAGYQRAGEEDRMGSRLERWTHD